MKSFSEYIEELQTNSHVTEPKYLHYLSELESLYPDEIDEEYLAEKHSAGMEQMLDRILRQIERLGNKENSIQSEMILELGAMIAVSVAMQTNNNRLYSIAKKFSSV